MPKELELQPPQEEEGGLSTGAQFGIAAFFIGLPFIGMGVEALGMGEAGLIVAALGAGVLGGGTKLLLDRNRSEDDEQGENDAPSEVQDVPRLVVPHLGILDRLQSADWMALFRPVGAPAPLPQPKEAREEDGQAAASQQYDAPNTVAPLTDEDALFTLELGDDTNGVARLTIEQIVRNCEPNSYKIYIGRSLTKPGNKAVLINIYKQHFRFMGASQRGKSSMVAAFLDIVTRTHDPKHVRLVLLDKENQTSNLFAHLPHVLPMRKADGQVVKMHARNDDQVLEYLIHCVRIMQHRYELPPSERAALPIILVYIEEFLALKNEFKARIDRAKNKAEREKAQSDYATLVYCIEALSQLGLKARVQLLLCAQVEYRDDDFVEALVNVQCGFSFCVRPTAAASAGFRNTELVKRNAKENKIGQAVVETPDCNDLVLAPDYDLEKRLIAFEKAHPDIYQKQADGNAEMSIYSPENIPVNGAASQFEQPSQKPHLHLLASEESEHESTEEPAVNENVNGGVNVSDEVKETIKRLVAMGVLKHNQIAKAVKLDGRNYKVYQQVCRELGIVIEREA